jgi:hypothetical protein
MANPTVSPWRANLNCLQEHTHSMTLKKQYMFETILIGTLAVDTDPEKWREAVTIAMQRLDRLYAHADKPEEAQKAGAA